MIHNIKILIFSKDGIYVNEIINNLRKYGYEINSCTTPETASDVLKKNTPFLIVIDDKFKKEANNEFIIEIRKTTDIPLVIISENKNIEYKLLCYSIGIDEFINKKWDLREAAARINAVLRRIAPVVTTEDSSNKVVTYDKLSINLTNYELKINGEYVDAPPKELELIYHLASNPNRVYTRDQLLDEVWGFEYYGNSRTVDVHVKRLREKLEGVSDEWELRTIWGVGYKFDTKS